VRRLLHLLFVLYCAEAGFFLVVVPWSAAWERMAASLGSASLAGMLGASIVRGAVSGFGLVHWVWGAHDLFGWMERRRSRETLRTKNPRHQPAGDAGG